MDIIKQLMEGSAALLAKALTGKESDKDNEIIIMHEALEPADLHMIINALVSEGEINEAENLLFEYMQSQPSEELYNTGMAMYARIAALSDSQLAAANYSREEIEQGKSDLAPLRPKYYY